MRKNHHKSHTPSHNLNTSTNKENSESFILRAIRFLKKHWMTFFLLCLTISGGLFFWVLNRKSSSTCSNFKVIRGNITTAELFLVGEDHSKKDLTDACINDITTKRGKPKHIVFQEGVIAGTELPDCTNVGISNYPNRTCEGWDDKNHHHKLFKINWQIQTIKLTLEVAKILNTASFADDELNKLIKNSAEYLTMHSNGINKAKLASVLLSIEQTEEEKKYQMAIIKDNVLNTVLKSRQKGISYQEIFAPFDKMHEDISFANFGLKGTDDINDRHKSLLQSVRKPGLKFAIIGRNHLIFGDKSDRKTRAEIDYLFRELERGKDKNPYAVLAIN